MTPTDTGSARGAAGRLRPFDEQDVGRTLLAPTYRIDLRPTHAAPDVFFDANPISDWSALTWSAIGRPYRVKRWSQEKRRWEREHDQELPVQTAWELFNRSFQRL
ncbi:MAG: class I SAM-dependent methyltransferase, partial [Thermomicrobiales bacterium]